jgi:hypothetical protein
MIAFILKLIGTVLFLNAVVYTAISLIQDYAGARITEVVEKAHNVSGVIVIWTMRSAIALVVLGSITAVVMFIWNL